MFLLQKATRDWCTLISSLNTRWLREI